MLNYAPYATMACNTRGRLYPEDECSTRSAYQRDRDRIIHSAAFRRLEYKTQVFINHEGDHYRTRLTHSLEVAQLARALCRSLQLNEDLGEAIALAHDLGHTPFGHAGEEGLCDVMVDYGSFDHNAQALKILTQLEQRYALFDGLNLSWETLEGVVKHNGPVVARKDAELPIAITEYNFIHDLELHTHAGAEAQVAALCDDIAYNNHDLEDGVRAKLFTLDELRDIPLIDDVITLVDNTYGSLPTQRRVHEVIRRVINRMVKDVLAYSSHMLQSTALPDVSAIRMLPYPVIGFSEEMLVMNRKLKTFLMKRMYRHYRVNRMTSKAKRVVSELFVYFFQEPQCLPTEWRMRVRASENDIQKARIVADFIAGMTDRFALSEHKRVFDVWEQG